MDLRYGLPIIALALVVGLASCADSRSGGDDDSGGDTDVDADTDVDSDSDSDCTEGEFFCVGNDVYECVGPNDESEYVETCEDPYECIDGECVYGGEINAIPETCEEAELGHTTVGCLFFAADLDLVGVYENNQYAIAVSNVQLENSASVTVDYKSGSDWTVVEGPVTVEPMSLYVFEVPNRNINGSGFLEGGAYRIESDVPIIAYHIQPYMAEGSYTSDASLLLPVPAWDSVHYLVGAELLNAGHEAYATIVSTADGTLVEVTPSCNTKPGGVIPAGTTGVPFTFTMNEGDMAQVAVQNVGDNPTGTLITSDEDHPIGVFTGNTCINIPIESGACDHLNEMLTGVQRWGKEFVAARMPVRSTLSPIEPSWWQMLASEDDTTIEFTASSLVTGLPGTDVTLDAGEVYDVYVNGVFEDPGDFYISADKPILVANYMTGSLTVNPLQEPTLGDPSIVQLAPVEQFLERYVVIVPEYWMNDVVTVVRVSGTDVEVDGEPMDDAEFIPVGPNHEVARVLVEDGVHSFVGDQGISVIVVGYDDDDSYAYLGGSGTSVINPIE